MPLRVGDSFVADGNNFAQAVLYGVDSGVLVIQEALGALNQTYLGAPGRGVRLRPRRGGDRLRRGRGRPAPQLAFQLSAHDRRQLVTKYDTFTPTPSYLQFNGCTNFSTKVTLAIPSTSCSSDATGVGSGLAGLIYSAAMNARDAGDLDDHPTAARERRSVRAERERGAPADGVGHGSTPVDQVDDINFATQPETACHPLPLPGCTDKNRLFTDATANRPVLAGSPPPRAIRRARATTSTTATAA